MARAFENSGNWAVILGASSGMGLAAAHKLASEGMHICFVYRDRKSELPRIKKELEQIRSHGVECLEFNVNALKDPDRLQIIDGLKAAIKPGQGVKLVMHSIARGNLKPLTTQVPDVDLNKILLDHNLKPVSEDELHSRTPRKTGLSAESEMTAEDYLLTVHAMAVSYYEWMQLIFKAKLFAKDALGIALTSEGNQRVWRFYGAVAAAKTSLEAISRPIALEFGGLGVRSNVIQAGVTDTPSLQMIPGSVNLKKNAILKNPMHRLTRPEDVANVIYLLCLPEASWINGAIIPVDGGESLS